MSDFETEVLGHFKTINTRLTAIELRVSGAVDDPMNRGIYGALTVVSEEVDAINIRQRRVTDDIILVKQQQTRQKAWLRGAAAGATFAGVTSVASLVKLLGAF